MSDAFDKLIELRDQQMGRGYKVISVRVDLDTRDEIMENSNLIMAGNPASSEDAIGEVAGMNVIPDGSIDEPVPEGKEIVMPSVNCTECDTEMLFDKVHAEHYCPICGGGR